MQPLLDCADLHRTLLWRAGRPVSAGAFLAQVRALQAQLPSGQFAVNLCADRYRFLVAFCAVACAGQTNLLPSSRAPQTVAEVLHSHANSYVLCDEPFEGVGQHPFVVHEPGDAGCAIDVPVLSEHHAVAIGFTSGSSGQPKANVKHWGKFCATTALNSRLLGSESAPVHIVATVPPQHMYGLELSVLLPLRSRAAIHAGQPFFPADIAHALGEVPAPRVLVTTPLHLRALLQAGPTLPEIATIVSATAPLDRELAAVAEKRHATRVVELFGSTETCVIAHRNTAQEDPWQPYAGVALHPQPDGTLVTAPYLAAPTLLHDLVEVLPSGRFLLRGRNGDLLEIAGKRASLGDLNHRLLAIPGVVDGVMFPLDPDANGVRRLGALVVAPDLSEADVLAAMRQAVDPLFLPRTLRRVDALPRNATGKLPREALLAALRG
jgi:acyl-coenzyme A synthetase/AMP-(fatty) acid ligase